MTPARRKAQQVYEWTTKELEEIKSFHKMPECNIGENYMAYRQRIREWENNPEAQQIRAYRSWLYDVQHYAEQRRRHPLVRLIRKSHHIGQLDPLPVKLSDKKAVYVGQETQWMFRWWWTDDTKDFTARRTEAPTLQLGGNHITALALPDLKHSGRAWFFLNRDRFKWNINWGLFTHERRLSVGVNLDGDDRDLTFHIRVPFLGFLFLTLERCIPNSWIPKERGTFTMYDPIKLNDPSSDRKLVTHEYERGMNINLGLDISGDHIAWEFFSVSEHMQSNGKRRGYVFLWDKILGRFDCTVEKIGSPVKAVACLPEGKYELRLQREIRTWKRPRWPWPYWQKYVDIEAIRPPEFQGKGENGYDCGPDAIWGMSSSGHSYEEAVANYVKAVLKERAKRGHLNSEHRTLIQEEQSSVADV